MTPTTPSDRLSDSVARVVTSRNQVNINGCDVVKLLEQVNDARLLAEADAAHLTAENARHIANYSEAVAAKCDLQARFDQLAARFHGAEAEAARLSAELATLKRSRLDGITAGQKMLGDPREQVKVAIRAALTSKDAER